MATENAPEVKDTVIDNVGLVYPDYPTAALSFAERHRTIGQVETVLFAKVVLSSHDGVSPNVDYDELEYGPVLLERYVPDGRTSACRFKSPGMSSAMGRMLALACECVKGYDSTSARLAASIFANSYNPIADQGHPLDMIFKGDKAGIMLELTFDSGKSTNPNLGLESQFKVYATIGTLVSMVDQIHKMLAYTDTFSPLPEVKVTTTATKAAKVVELDLDWS